jgi:hypothetical protein
VVRLLLDSGADPVARGSDGRPCEGEACTSGLGVPIGACAFHGSSPDGKNRTSSALEVAAVERHRVGQERPVDPRGEVVRGRPVHPVVDADRGSDLAPGDCGTAASLRCFNDFHLAPAANE